MIINCNNKGCMKTSEALLDVKTMEVMCQECGKPITNISEPMRRTLKSNGQIIREAKKAFMMHCRQCAANRQIAYIGGKTLCSTCSTEINVPAPMKQAMKEIAAARAKEEDV